MKLFIINLYIVFEQKKNKYFPFLYIRSGKLDLYGCYAHEKEMIDDNSYF